MKKDYVEPMVVDKNGNIYFSAKYLYEENDERDKEIERLNNIISETRKGLDRFYKEHSRLMWNEEDYIEFINCIDRELKGDSSNE